jgi:hypothetical protein
VERIYVQKEVYDEFVEEYVKTVKSFKMGDPMDSATYLGPLTRGSQVPTTHHPPTRVTVRSCLYVQLTRVFSSFSFYFVLQLSFLEEQVKDAVAKGGKLLLGGKRASVAKYAALSFSGVAWCAEEGLTLKNQPGAISSSRP